MRIENVDWGRDTAFLQFLDSGSIFDISVPRLGGGAVTSWVVYVPSGYYGAYVDFEHNMVEVWTMPDGDWRKLVCVYPEQRKKIQRNLPEWF